MVNWWAVVKGALSGFYRLCVLFLLSCIVISLARIEVYTQAAALNSRFVAELFDTLYQQPFKGK